MSSQLSVEVHQVVQPPIAPRRYLLVEDMRVPTHPLVTDPVPQSLTARTIEPATQQDLTTALDNLDSIIQRIDSPSRYYEWLKRPGVILLDTIRGGAVGVVGMLGSVVLLDDRIKTPGGLATGAVTFLGGTLFSRRKRLTHSEPNPSEQEAKEQQLARFKSARRVVEQAFSSTPGSE